MTRKELRLAFVGATVWAQTYHLPALRHLMEKYPLHITGIWNRTTSKAVDVAKRFGIEKVYRSLDELVRDDEVNCVSIVVHPAALMEILPKLLSRNLPLLCEKPPGQTFEEAKTLSRMVTVPNVVAFNRRYNPLNQQFKRVVEQMSHVYYAECQFYRNKRYYQDFITATGIHGINYMEYLFGPIETVTTDKWKNPVNDTHIWVNRVSFASGINGLMKFFPCSGANLERYEVHSTDTSAYLYSPQAYTEDIPGQIMVYQQSQLQPLIRGDKDENPLMTLGFVNEYSDFFEACMQNTPTISNFQDACHSMRIAEAIETGNDIP